MDGLGERLRTVRTEKAFTQKRLSEDAGVSIPSIVRIERTSAASAETIRKLAAALGVRIEWLTTGKGKRDV